MPVLPPTEESTCASSVVGTCTKRMPRRTRLAARPARSPMTPPPSATTSPPRSSPISSRRSHRLRERRRSSSSLRPARGLSCLRAGRAPPTPSPADRDGAAATFSSVTMAHLGAPSRAWISSAACASRPGADQHVVGALAEPDVDGRRLVRHPPAAPAWLVRRNGAHGEDASRLPGGSPAAGCAASASMISPTITSCGTSRLSTTMSAVA